MNISATNALVMVANISFKPFDKDDWCCFAGCQSTTPLIGYTPDEEYVVVLDGDVIHIQGNVFDNERQTTNESITFTVTKDKR